MYENIAIAILAVVFAYAYTHEEEDHLKFLFGGMMLACVAFSITTSQVVLNTLTTSQPGPYNLTTHSTITNSSCYQNTSVSYTYYYLNSTNSGYNVTDMFYSLSPNLIPTNSQLTSIVPAVSGHFKIFQFITPAGVPDLSVLSKGIYQFHLHAYSNDTVHDMQLYSQLWVIAPADNNTFMIAQSGLSQALQPNITEYINSVYVNQSTIIPSYDRLGLFVFANYTDSFGTPINITLYMGGQDNAHVSVPLLARADTCFTQHLYSTAPIQESNSVVMYGYSNNNNINTFMQVVVYFIYFVMILYFLKFIQQSLRILRGTVPAAAQNRKMK